MNQFTKVLIMAATFDLALAHTHEGLRHHLLESHHVVPFGLGFLSALSLAFAINKLSKRRAK